MITRYTEYNKKSFKMDLDLDLYFAIQFDGLYLKVNKSFMHEDYRYNVQLLFNKLKTYFKSKNMIFRKSAGEFCYYISKEDLDIRIRNFITVYWEILYDNPYNRFKIPYKKEKDIINFIKDIFEFKLNDDMVKALDKYLETTDINFYCKKKCMNDEYINNPFFIKLVDEYCDNETIQHITTIRHAKNFDLI